MTHASCPNCGRPLRRLGARSGMELDIYVFACPCQAPEGSAPTA